MQQRASKAIDIFQIVGFSVSILLSVGLVLAGQDTINSASLGSAFSQP